ncbi:protein farnesyltransferase subunit beta [Cucumis melo var. makuwa]|uniref:Protein farnesyltransferase subunit beta n=1 Tax=Cucumis melo var. makuwa TaxID=1194695 RepID=A0A5A7UD15_CUCMM|nr:protein farnesyltransferase subunit beta [Cucumis melo var. makuwa]
MEAPVPEQLTETQQNQRMVEYEVARIYDFFLRAPRSAQEFMLELQRENHIEYLTNGLNHLGPSFRVLDANRPWICYWILHSIALLGDSVDAELEARAIDFLNRCQLPHLATTYAAVNSLVTLGSHEALSSINRHKLYTFLLQMKHPSGGFRMHDQGEIDVRACYTAISVASILNILDDELVQNVGNYIQSCQTFEGGIAGEPGSEAHGGYTFCGLATLILINEVHRLDLRSLLDWVVFRQAGLECGFQGRTNKLVDGCYSFWQGGVCSLLKRLSLDIDEQSVQSDAREGSSFDDLSTGVDTSRKVNYNDVGYEFIKKHPSSQPLFNSLALQQYILLCAQVPEGGLRDKPGKPKDYYHTCYCLSGLSLCQYSLSNEDSPPLPQAVAGPYSNLLEPVHPLYNVVFERAIEALDFFRGK